MRANLALQHPAVGYTVRELARLLRVGQDRVRGWIKSGQLEAINTSDATCRKPRYVVLPHQLAEFTAVRSPAPPPKQQRRRRKTEPIDFFPGD